MAGQAQDFFIRGLVIDRRTLQGVPGVRVEAWDRDVLVDDMVGNALTDGRGAFEIRFGGEHFRELFLDRRPDLYCKVFRGAELLASTEGSVRWQAEGEIEPVTITVEQGIPAPADARFSVRGSVASSRRIAVPGLRVVAVDKSVGPDLVLGEAESDGRGAYFIAYDPGLVLARGKKRPDLQVRVSANGEEVAASGIRFGAGSEESIDVVVPEGRVEPAPEHARLLRELTRLLGASGGEEGSAAGLEGLQEDAERQDITYLANKSGWDARLVALAALAERLAVESRVPAELLYALFRAGVPASEVGLAAISAETAREIWQQSVARGIIASPPADRLEEALRALAGIGSEQVLEFQGGVGASPLGEVLDLSLEGEARTDFARILREHGRDPRRVWEEARTRLGPERTERLQLDARLASLTVNNAPLLRRLHEGGELRSPRDLVRRGLYRADAWESLLEGGVPVPRGVAGADADEKRANYAAFLASQLRLGYPTAVVGEMVRGGELPLDVDDGVREGVGDFLAGEPAFELGIQPVEQYVARNRVEVAPAVLTEVKRLQRVYQISPTDEALGTLLESRLDSAQAIAQWDEGEFVARFAKGMGGEATARLVHAKAQQVHTTVLNVATTYLLRQTAPTVYALSSPAANGVAAAGDGEIGVAAYAMTADETGVIAMPTLESLLGELDYCACDHCRSVLSPAAYLVDLLRFLDLRRYDSAGVELPPSYQKENPLDVLLGRRPDLEHLQLTCENTNTALPHIDLANEILEYIVLHQGSIQGFRGHDVEPGTESQELLANPRFVEGDAYANHLKPALFPPPLPFFRELEALRAYFRKFEVPLHEAMEELLPAKVLDLPGQPQPAQYAVRDVLMERLGLSRAEHGVLTDDATALQTLFGEDAATVSLATLRTRLSGAKAFARTMQISYEELIELLRTEFINPDSHLIRKLERLQVNFATIQALEDGDLTAAEFEALLPELDLAQYGGDVVAWLGANHQKIMGLIVLSDPAGGDDLCQFDTIELRHADPDAAGNRLREWEFLKLLRFIRLWRKLGWTIEQTDQVLTALYPANQRPGPGDTEADARTKLGAGFRELIVRLGVVVAVMEKLELKPQRELARALAMWSPIATHGTRSLYREMFLSPAMLALDPVFAENGYGGFLVGAGPIGTHREALRSAFNLSAEELDAVLAHLGFNAQTPLDLESASRVFRWGYLARKLRLSVQELVALATLSGIDPFAALDPLQPRMLEFIDLVVLLRDSGLQAAALQFYVQHRDPTGKAAPTSEAILALARAIREELRRIDREHAVQDDPTGELARSKMALVYGAEVADTFFGLLNGSTRYRVAYGHATPALEADLLAVTDRLAYDDFRQELSFQGMMTDAVRDALVNAPSATPAFDQAVQAIQQAARDEFAGFFDHFPELKASFDAYDASADPLPDRLSVVLAAFLPGLRARLKRQQVLQTVSARVGSPLALVSTLLENPAVLQDARRTGAEAITDFLRLDEQGLSARYFFADEVGGPPAVPVVDVARLEFGPGAAALPANPAGGNAKISVELNGYVEVPASGLYNFLITADAGAQVELAIGANPLAVVAQGNSWRNQQPIELKAGTPYPIRIVVEKVASVLRVRWESQGLARETIPAQWLYPEATVASFGGSYQRLLKALDVAARLRLSSRELRHFAALPAYRIGGAGWLDALPVAPAAAVPALFDRIAALARYARLRSELKIGDDTLVRVLADAGATDDAGGLLLEGLARWSPQDVTALLVHLGLARADLQVLDRLVAVHRVFRLLRKLGVSAPALIAATTNEPDAARVVNLQSALRARYDAAGWRTVQQEVNDGMRELQRDALVAYVLHELGRVEATRHIDTPERLYEHLLIDVQMASCTKTSRIRQAISAVQLFTQRCLLNLEPEVAASSIRTSYWAWMKRYRVWEANRKVFLFPENWLEPELRPDKSPLFRELESDLLQSDITEDSAANALRTYLQKLEEVAKLEICGMHLVENDLANVSDDLIHVVGRTAGARRTYHYRRQEGVFWTPWEKMDVSIEDNPVLPVVWKDRLFVFWLGVLQDIPSRQGAPVTGSDRLENVTPSQMSGNTSVKVNVTLYWSEYLNGKWQPARTSDLNRPITLGEFPPSGPGSFDRSGVGLRSVVTNGGELLLEVAYGHTQYFILYNTHSLPVRNSDSTEGFTYLVPIRRRYLFEESGGLIAQHDTMGGDLVTHRILNRARLFQIVSPRHSVNDAFTTPFFFQDRRHVFFVRPVESRILVPDDSPDLGFVIDVDLPKREWVEIPRIFDRHVVEEILDELVQGGPGGQEPPGPRPGPYDRDSGVTDPLPLQRLFDLEPQLVHVLSTSGTVKYGETHIGVTGAVPPGAANQPLWP